MKLLLLSIALYSCTTYPCGSPKQVMKWEKKTKFRSATKECDSLRHLKMLAMARKY